MVCIYLDFVTNASVTEKAAHSANTNAKIILFMDECVRGPTYSLRRMNYLVQLPPSEL